MIELGITIVPSYRTSTGYSTMPIPYIGLDSEIRYSSPENPVKTDLFPGNTYLRGFVLYKVLPINLDTLY